MNSEPARVQIAKKFFITMLAALLVIIGTKQVQAVAPTNDAFTNPTVISGLPFNEVVDTTEATTDADDAQVNSFCGTPATDASVWYAFTPSEDTNVIVDVSGSDYSAGILVSIGNLADNFIACGPGSVGFAAVAGTTYYVLAFDDQFDGVGNGGNLSISFTAVPAATLEITVDKFGQFNSKSGTATISGSYTCTNGSFIETFGSASQRVGRIATISGSFGFFDFDTCDGEAHAWSAEVFPQTGQFKGGKALTVTFSYTCGLFQCATGYIEQTVQLRGGSRGGPAASSADVPGVQLFLPSIVTRE